MKSTFLFSVFVLFFITAQCQTNDYRTFSLGVEKEYPTHKKAFVFKPNKTLKIMTSDNKKYASDHYTFSDKFIVMDMKDTILFDNISWIKGSVYGDKGRKIAGATIALCAVGSGSLATIVVAFMGGAVIFTTTPFIAMTYGGIKLAGTRKFWRMQDCYVKVIERQKP